MPLAIRTALPRFAVLLGALALLWTSACGSIALPSDDSLSFAEMQTLNPGVSGEWILQNHPQARQVQRRSDGTLSQLSYWVTDPNGTSRGLVLDMDAQGLLATKRYGGPIVRPPAED